MDFTKNFYLARTINALHFDDSDDAIELRLSYTDGTVTDKVDENNELAQLTPDQRQHLVQWSALTDENQKHAENYISFLASKQN